MYIYKLNRIKFNNGDELEPGNLTVIIGPNNSGKSRILRDLVQKTTNRQPIMIVVNDVEWEMPQSLQALTDSYTLERYQDSNNNWSFRSLNVELASEKQVNASLWPQFQNNPTRVSNLLTFSDSFGFAMIAFITTEHRLQLVKEAPSANHEKQENNLLQSLYNAGSALEREIQNLTKRAFGKEVKLDFTVPQRLLLRIGDDFSSIPPDPREAKPLMQKYEKLDDQGDGIRSFVGITTALLATKRNVFLIDEPEAFLHPPQAFRIGEFIANQAKTQRQVLSATHSVDVLRGILNSTTDVTILRVDRRENTNYLNKLELSRLQELVNDPLLSSARVLDGLFYSGVVVVEADSDGRFYQTASNKRKNNIDVHFVNADNKQTVPRITSLYRDMGVRCVGIVDFDVLSDAAEFRKQLEAIDLAEEDFSTAIEARDKIAAVAQEITPEKRLEKAEEKITDLYSSLTQLKNKTFSSDDEAKAEKERWLSQVTRRTRDISNSTKHWKELKEKGREALSPDIQSAFDNLWQICSQKGLFINPCGELESMLVPYGISYTTNKREWISTALSLLPNLEVNDSQHPWKFIKLIHKYLEDEQ